MSTPLPAILAPRFDSMPPELTSRPQWVVWRAQWLPDKGKYSKIPVNARTGSNAKSNLPATWSTFEQARTAYERDPAPRNDPEKGFAGVGFVLAETDPFCGVDLDHVVVSKDGERTLDDSAASIVAALDTYAEVSPSGTGIRLFAVATLPPGGRKNGDTECYESGRFLTVTGRRLPQVPPSVNERQPEIETFHAEAFPAPVKPIRTAATGAGVDANDTELLELAIKAKNGAKVAALYSGNPAGYEGPSEADFALCAFLAFYTGDNPARLDAIFRSSGLMRDKWDERRYADGSTYGQKTVERAIAGCSKFYGDKMEATSRRSANKPPRPKLETDPEFGGEPDDKDALPVIVLTDRQDRHISADAWKAVHLANTPPHLFARGMGAACLARDAETGRVVVQEVNEERMLYRLRRVGNFVTVRQTKIGEMETNNPPPLRIAKDMLFDSDQVNSLPVLRGVVNAPVVCSSGKLLTTPGYHPSARLYVATEGLTVTVPDAPTQEDAQAAYGRLFGAEGIFGEFPYATDADRANAAALLFGLFLRPYIGGNVPMVLVEAPEKGTGKTLLAEAITAVFEPSISSREAPTAGNRDEAQIEWRKVLTSALREAPTVLFFDNVQGVLASSALEALITTTNYTGRILGTAEQVTFNTDALTIVATSNNPEASEDMARRVNVIRLDAEMERPIDRQNFRIPDLKAYVKENRGQIVGDVLAILSAWLRAGAVQGKAHKASFERWARILSGVLDFVKAPGFLENDHGLGVASDPERAKWILFAHRVFEIHGQSAKQAKELLDLAAEVEIITDANDRGASRSLGKAMQKNRERVFDGLKLLGKTDRNGVLRYSYRPVEGKYKQSDADMGDLGKESAGFAGFAGFSSKSTRDPNNIEINKDKGIQDSGEKTPQTPQTPHFTKPVPGASVSAEKPPVVPDDDDSYFHDPFAPVDDIDAPPDHRSDGVGEDAPF